MRHVIVSSALVVVASAAACGPGPTPQEPQPGADAGAAARGATSPTTGEPLEGQAGGGGGAGGDRTAENKKGFMEGCLRAGEGMQAFCDCAFGEVRAVTGDRKMAAEGPNQEDALRARPRVLAKCKDKMPEAAVKVGYMAECSADRAEMNPYCECTWSEFRKSFSPGDLRDEAVVTSDKFTAAKAAVVKTCGPKIAEKVVKEGFMKTCVHDPAMTTFCTCAWDELKKTATVAEVEAGLVDREKMTARIDTACSKHKPAKK